jgi:hypothetical protein
MHSANFYYYGLTKNTLLDVLKEALWIAKEQMECDAFSCMSIMDNVEEICIN